MTIKVRSVLLSCQKNEIIRLAKNQDVIYLDYYTGDHEIEYRNDTNAMDCSDTFDASRGNVIHNDIGLTGNGVIVGIIEQKVPCPNIDISANKIIYLDTDTDYSNQASNNLHTTRVARVMISNTGIAPNAKVAYATQGNLTYSDSDLPTTSYSTFVNAAEKQYSAYGNNSDVTSPIAVVNYSMGDTDWYGNPYTDKEKYIDFLAYRKKLLFVTPVGNDHYRIGSPSQAYNSISPGGFFNSGSAHGDRTSTDTDIMYSMSRYYDPTVHANACYKPDFVSPQISFAPYVGNIYTGTSFAAPFVTGTIALLYELRPSLRAQPDVIKAILLASCHRKVAPSGDDPTETMEQGITAHQGAGAMDPYRAIAIAASGNYGVRTLENASSYQTINFVQPAYDSSSINFSIAWLRNNPVEGATSNMVDLDLELYQGTTFLGSSEKDTSSTEMVYHTILPNDTGCYQAIINGYGSSGTSVKYAYAFSVSNAHFQNVTQELQNGNETYYNNFVTEGLYFLRNKQSGKYLSYGGGNLVMSDFSGSHSQAWLIKDSKVKTDCLTHGMLNAASNYYGNFRYALATNGSGVNVSFSSITNNNDSHHDKTGAYKILNYNTGEALSYADSLAAWFTSNSSSSQQWYIERAAYEKGDVDMDGKVTANDAQIILSVSANLTNINDIQMFLADIDGDDSITASDALHTLNLSNETPYTG